MMLVDVYLIIIKPTKCTLFTIPHPINSALGDYTMPHNHSLSALLKMKACLDLVWPSSIPHSNIWGHCLVRLEPLSCLSGATVWPVWGHRLACLGRQTSGAADVWGGRRLGRQTSGAADVWGGRRLGRQTSGAADVWGGRRLGRQTSGAADVWAGRRLGRQTSGEADVWGGRRLGRQTSGEADVWGGRRLGRQTSGEADVWGGNQANVQNTTFDMYHMPT